MIVLKSKMKNKTSEHKRRDMMSYKEYPKMYVVDTPLQNSVWLTTCFYEGEL